MKVIIKGIIVLIEIKATKLNIGNQIDCKIKIESDLL